MSTEQATAQKVTAKEVTVDLLTKWATDPAESVALHLKQQLLPVTAQADEPGIIYPPTYADIGYNIDTLSDNKRVALIDSVGSQANRMEPIFKQKFSANGPDEANGQYLVPQIKIILHDNEKRSLLDLAHRSADAVVKSCPELATKLHAAFKETSEKGIVESLCNLSPTSLIFGCWDSRGFADVRLPRIVRSTIRAWDVDELHSAAQFNSVWKALDENQQAELKKAAKTAKVKLSVKGFADAPATVSKNTGERVLGGVLVRDRIEREVTVNLLTLRNVRGTAAEDTAKIQKYLLGLALLAATHEIDLFLREGCHLRYASTEDDWYAVPRRGTTTKVNLGSEVARATILQFALDAAKPLREKWPEKLEYSFNLAEAKKLLAKKDEDNPDEE